MTSWTCRFFWHMVSPFCVRMLNVYLDVYPSNHIYRSGIQELYIFFWEIFCVCLKFLWPASNLGKSICTCFKCLGRFTTNAGQFWITHDTHFLTRFAPVFWTLFLVDFFLWIWCLEDSDVEDMEASCDVDGSGGWSQVEDVEASSEVDEGWSQFGSMVKSCSVRVETMETGGKDN